MSEILSRLFVMLQRLLPKYVLTTLVRRIARIRQVSVKNFLIRMFAKIYKVDVRILVHPLPDGFPTFNDFFIRELDARARTVDSKPSTIVSPVDGTVSACGKIDRDQIFQAKGLRYSLTDLLATDLTDADLYANGSFATIYLAPYNYHRVHAPLAGELTAMHYIPGTLFSVNEATVRHLPQLFARNERLACHIETEYGPMILLFVGAMNVGTINTIWTGDIRPVKNGIVENFNVNELNADRHFDKGDTLGWFNMGSTVILITPPKSGDLFADIEAGQTIRMGEAIGQIPGKS